MSTSPTQSIMRSSLGRARGLGSAKSGTAHWWAERVTSVALVPLTLWFIFVVFQMISAPRAAVIAWAASPLNATLLVALVLITFHHMALGLQVVLDDYIHDEKTRLVSVVAMKAVVALLAIASLLAALKLALAG